MNIHIQDALKLTDGDMFGAIIAMWSVRCYPHPFSATPAELYVACWTHRLRTHPEYAYREIERIAPMLRGLRIGVQQTATTARGMGNKPGQAWVFSLTAGSTLLPDPEPVAA